MGLRCPPCLLGPAVTLVAASHGTRTSPQILMLTLPLQYPHQPFNLHAAWKASDNTTPSHHRLIHATGIAQHPCTPDACPSHFHTLMRPIHMPATPLSCGPYWFVIFMPEFQWTGLNKALTSHSNAYAPRHNFTPIPRSSPQHPPASKFLNPCSASSHQLLHCAALCHCTIPM